VLCQPASRNQNAFAPAAKASSPSALGRTKPKRLRVVPLSQLPFVAFYSPRPTLMHECGTRQSDIKTMGLGLNLNEKIRQSLAKTILTFKL